MSFSPEEYATEIRKMLAEPKLVDKSWAKRILDRHAGGEYVHPLALKYALEASGDGPAPRVPGED